MPGTRTGNAGGGRRTSAARSFVALAGSIAVACLVLAPRAGAQAQERDSKEEEFETVDPYTRGERAAFDKAGYVSLGPFPLAEGIRTTDVEEALGGIRILWVETDHFRLGSTLATYKFQGDQREEKKIDKELDRLAKRLARYRPPNGKLDPWLRLHLYAQRLEEIYADFLARFGFTDADFARKHKNPPAPGTPAYMGEGPYLGQEQKFVVLLCEKSSGTGRFASRFLKKADAPSYREWFPGGGMYQGTSVQAWRELGYELDATLHCVVACDLAKNLVDGFRKSWFAAPTWFQTGLGHWYSRRADERFTVYATGTTRDLHDDSWEWEPRIRGLVINKAQPPWKEMFAWQPETAPKPHEHMVVWSRVDWMLAQKDADLRAFLIGITDSLQRVPEEQRAAVVLARQEQALAAAFGRPVDELDEAWRKHVVSRYARD